ncbi:MAG: SBBP repeat-containing protein [Planctomycetota bacterium]|nr:SBBP repeat-containing protein [Planctomycetota bacterium]
MSGRARNHRWLCTMLGTLLVLLVNCGENAGAPRRSASSPPDLSGPLPLPSSDFTENAGQVENGDVLFYVTTGGVKVGLSRSEILLAVVEPAQEPMARDQETLGSAEDAIPPERVRGVLVRVGFEGSNSVLPEGVKEKPYRSHYLFGSDPMEWHRDVRSFDEVVYTDLYDGIDLIYQATPTGLKYAFRVQPGADPREITLVYEGVEGLRIDLDGSLIIDTAVGEIHDGAPLAYDASGAEIGCRLEIRGRHSVGFECSGWDGTRPLLIDPHYSTYLGGTDSDDGFSIAVDAAGSAYIAGPTSSVNFPATAGAFDVSLGNTESAFVAKLTPDGSNLVYATYIGGNRSTDAAQGLAIDNAGSAYVTGRTKSRDFPVTHGAYDRSHNGRADAFVVKLTPDGSGMIYGTFIGGSDADRGNAISVDAAGCAYVVGRSKSGNFPATVGAFDTSPNGRQDAFVAKLNAAGSALVYATYLGGNRDDDAQSVQVDAGGNAYVTGDTDSGNFPTTGGAFDTSLSGNSDAYVTKLTPAGDALVYSTYLGGNKSDRGGAIAVDVLGSAYVTGRTKSGNFPTTTGAFDETHNGDDDVFVAKLEPSGNGLVYATFLGGSGFDDGRGITLLGREAYVTGRTESGGFPVTPGAFDESHKGDTDAFVARLLTSGSGLVYSTFLGGNRDDDGRSVATDSLGDAYVTGNTKSNNFPVTAGAFDTTRNGKDAFVSKLGVGGGLLCPRGQGYWKNHPDLWPVTTLDLGFEACDQASCLVVLGTPTRGDASVILMKQLIAAKLNVANGSDLAVILPCLADADALLAGFAGMPPYDVAPSTATGQSMVDVAGILDDYNNGLLTPNCR